MTSIIGVTHPKKSYVLVELTKIKKLKIRKLRKKNYGCDRCDNLYTHINNMVELTEMKKIINEKNQYLKSGQGYSDKDHHFHDMKIWMKKII